MADSGRVVGSEVVRGEVRESEVEFELELEEVVTTMVAEPTAYAEAEALLKSSELMLP